MNRSSLSLSIEIHTGTLIRYLPSHVRQVKEWSRYHRRILCNMLLFTYYYSRKHYGMSHSKMWVPDAMETNTSNAPTFMTTQLTPSFACVFAIRVWDPPTRSGSWWLVWSCPTPPADWLKRFIGFLNSLLTRKATGSAISPSLSPSLFYPPVVFCRQPHLSVGCPTACTSPRRICAPPWRNHIKCFSGLCRYLLHANLHEVWAGSSLVTKPFRFEKHTVIQFNNTGFSLRSQCLFSRRGSSCFCRTHTLFK
jgi:hypothetical protein